MCTILVSELRPCRFALIIYKTAATMTKPIDPCKRALLARIEALDTPEAIAQLHRELDILELKEQHPDLQVGLQPHRALDELAKEQGYVKTNWSKMNELIAQFNFGEDVDAYFESAD